MKKLVFWRWQRILVLAAVASAVLLLLPFLHLSPLKDFWPSARFMVPKVPEIQVAPEESVEVETIEWKLASDDPKLLAMLQAQGWPAYMKEKNIYIGPYLKSFQSQVDLDKIKKVTTLPVKMVD